MRTTEYEMVDGITDSMDMSFEQAPGAGDGQGSLVCCSPWCRKESDMTEWLIWIDWLLKIKHPFQD